MNQKENKRQPTIIWGGADIDPALYGEPRAGCGWTNRHSDEHELKRINDAVAEGRPIIGICRGLQMLTVHQGGKLIQHITPQGGPKLIEDKATKEKIPVTKAHHQACILNNVKNYHVLAESRIEPDGITIPEVVYFPDINAIGIQGHPEWAATNSPINKYMFDKIQKYLGIEIKEWR